MKNNLFHYDVIIVGLGPIGQFIANLFNKSSLKIAIIEKLDKIYSKSSAVVLDDEIMRAISNLSIYNEFKEKISIPKSIDFEFPDGKVIQSSLVKKTSNGFATISTFYQPDLEKLLTDSLKKSKNVDVFYQCELIDFKESNKKILLTYKDLNSKETEILSGKFLLACDGIDSSIKSKLKIPDIDMQYSKDWLIVDVILNKGAALDKAVRQICDSVRPTVSIHMPANRHRFEFQLLAGEISKNMQSVESATSLLSTWLKPNEFSIDQIDIYKSRAKRVSEWKRGNVILLGDSAHQVPPYAAQGINSGIRDAINLFWKLNLVLKGSVHNSVLESYQIEREIHLVETIKSSIALGQLIDSISVAYKKKTPLKDAVAPEARDQAYGGRKANPSKETNPGIFYNSLQHKFTGILLPRFDLTDGDGVRFSVDSIIDYCLTIISSGNIGSELSTESMKAYKSLGAKFIDISKYSYKNSEFSEIISCGSLIVRPDLYIFGVTDKDSNLQDLSDQLFKFLAIS